MKRFLSLGAAFLCSLLLAACYVPEKFRATLDFQPNGSYTYEYVGTIVNVMGIAGAKEGKLTANDRKSLDAFAVELKKDPTVRAAKHLGDGRYDINVTGKRDAGKRLDFLSMMSVATDRDGVVHVSSPEVKAKDVAEFAKIGLTVDGTLSVKVPKGAEVISHNATSTPTFGFGSYSWKIGKIDQRPMMKVRFTGK